MTRDITPNEWARLGALLDRLLDADPDHRATLLTELAGGDGLRRAELESLVRNSRLR